MPAANTVLAQATIEPANSAGLCDEASRTRLAAHAETPPELLLRLAGDPSVTVRGALALNEAAPLQADHRLALDSDERVRLLLARKLAALTSGLAAAEQDRLHRHACSMLALLVADAAVRVRAAIAEIVKEMPDAPKELVLRLAQDAAIPVSDPVLRLSPLLTPQDLLALLAAAPNRSTGTSIARRSDLVEAVSDAIAATADTSAIRALLANPSAAIREATLDALIARAAEHTEWHEPLVHRPALSAHAVRALSRIVATRLLAALAGRADLDAGIVQELRRRLDHRLRLAELLSPTAPGPAGEEPLQRALQSTGELTERALLEAARRGEADYLAGLLALAAGLPVGAVKRAASLRSAKALVSLVWQAGLPMRVAGPVQTVLGRLDPSAVLAPAPDGSFPLTEEEMRWQVDFLGRMD